MLYESSVVQYPEGKGPADFNHSDVEDYSFSQFKNELEEALGCSFLPSGCEARKQGIQHQGKTPIMSRPMWQRSMSSDSTLRTETIALA